jgi:hypothetical protein
MQQRSLRSVRSREPGAEYMREAVEHEQRAATMTNPKLQAGFLDLARMSRLLAAHMERQMVKQAPLAPAGLDPFEKPRGIVPRPPSPRLNKACNCATKHRIAGRRRGRRSCGEPTRQADRSPYSRSLTPLFANELLGGAG